jgi:hypothetical protein
MREYSRLEVGYDFTDGSIERAIPKKVLSEAEKELRNVRAKNTCEMLLFAIERSGSGPPKGTMNLQEDDSGGTAAFLRAVKNYTHVVFPPDYVDVITDLQDSHEKTDYYIKIEKKESCLVIPHQAMATDGPYKICKSSVSPLVLFLHVDQGSFESGGYTPFASPVCNSRSVHKKHVDGVSQEVVQGHPVVSQEDFAILGYQVIVDDYESEEESESEEKSEAEVEEEEEEAKTEHVDGEDDTTGEGQNQGGTGHELIDKDSESEAQQQMETSGPSVDQKNTDGTSPVLEVEKEEDKDEEVEVEQDEDESDEESSEEESKMRPIYYRCILDRDSESENIIVSKDATLVTMDNMTKIFWRVSYIILGFVPSTQMKTTLLSNTQSATGVLFTDVCITAFSSGSTKSNHSNCVCSVLQHSRYVVGYIFQWTEDHVQLGTVLCSFG